MCEPLGAINALDAPLSRCELTLSYERLPDGGLARSSGGEWLVRERAAPARAGAGAVAHGGDGRGQERHEPLTSALLALRALRVVSAWEQGER